jgi:hypothetical protein
MAASDEEAAGTRYHITSVEPQKPESAHSIGHELIVVISEKPLEEYGRYLHNAREKKCVSSIMARFDFASTALAELFFSPIDIGDSRRSASVDIRNSSGGSGYNPISSEKKIIQCQDNGNRVSICFYFI